MIDSNPDHAPDPKRGVSLTTKLVLLVAGTLVLVGVPVLLLFLPQSRDRFQDHTEDLILISHEGMRDISENLIQTHQDVVVDLATHISDTYARELADVPLSLAQGDESKIRSLILEQVHQLRRTFIRNVEILGEELRHRSEASVADQMASQRAVQRDKGGQFARDLHRESIGFIVFLILAPLPVLLIGLYRMVLRPLANLAMATTRARGGDLSFSLPVTSKDEIGSLQASFNRMISDLETSRQDAEQWNASLEKRVQEKTVELSESLDEQRQVTTRLSTTLNELRETQSQLIHAEKMASLGHLSASVAHEFNNLLGGIIGSAEAALEEEPAGTTREACEVIRSSARRACVITDNLLRFSRKQESYKEHADFNRILEDCLKLMEPEFRKRSIVVESRLEALPTVPVDSGQIHQVFLNLLTNAVHAIGQTGTLQVSTRKRGKEVLCTVRDSGPGVPEAIRSRIFEPFFTTREPGQGGTGLGLSVSYGIVTNHGGTLELKDDPEGHTTFEITLPLTDEGVRRHE